MKPYMSFLTGLVAILLLVPLPARSFHTGDNKGGAASVTGKRSPVLVELFTSEGCSSCPPADQFLKELDRSQPVPNAEAIVLSEHVDYWNNLGWKDPYSSAEWTERQSAYASRFGLDSVYTPQMVVDGQSEMVGSDEQRAVSAIARAAAAGSLTVTLSDVRREGDAVLAHIEVGPLPASARAKSADILVAIADDSDESSVRRGENAGRNLTHVAVLRSLSRVGTVDGQGEFSQDIKIAYPNQRGGGLRIVAFVQEKTARRIWGVGTAHIAE